MGMTGANDVLRGHMINDFNSDCCNMSVNQCRGKWYMSVVSIASSRSLYIQQGERRTRGKS